MKLWKALENGNNIKYLPAYIRKVVSSVIINQLNQTKKHEKSIDSQKIETIDGVRVVHNEKGGKWGNKPEISIKLLRTIGDIDTEDNNLTFDTPLDIGMDATGNFYILDSANQRIQKFSPEGKYLATIGRKGQGPGEFENPFSFDIDTKGFLYISDTSQNRLQVLRPDGGEFKTIQTTGLGLGRIRLLKSGLMAAIREVNWEREYVKGKSLPKLVRLLDLQLKIKNEFGEVCDYDEIITNQFGNSTQVEVDKDDNIYLEFHYQNRIEKYSPNGKLLWRAERPLNFGTKPIEKGKIETTANTRKYQSPKMNRCSNGIATDGKNRVWILTMNRQLKDEEKVYTSVSGGPSGITRKIVGNTDLRTTNAYKLEVFDSSGILLGEIPIGHFADDIRILGDNLFMVDRMRGVKYYQYKIAEN